MRTLLELAGVVALLTFSWAVIYTSHAIPKEIRETRVALLEEVRQTRQEASRQISEAQQRVIAELDRTRRDVLRHTDRPLREVTANLDKAEHDLDGQLSRTNESLARLVDGSLGHAETLVANTTEIKDHMLEREPMVYSRFLATTGEMNRTLDASRRAGEELAAATPKLLDDVTRITDKAADYIAPKDPPKRHWYSRWLPQTAVIAGKIIF